MRARLNAALELARKYVWALLLLAYPYADQIIATVEGWMPALAPHLGVNTFRYMGFAIVVAKFSLQVYRGWLQIKPLLANKTGGV
jgi:hypothetical protein